MVTPLGLKKIDATEDPLKLLADHFEGLRCQPSLLMQPVVI
jgi:hypothetical protein